jgi:hypothetical protein
MDWLERVAEIRKICNVPAPARNVAIARVSNWTKIFTVIASEAKQSQPLRLLHFTSFHMANATQRLRNDIV